MKRTTPVLITMLLVVLAACGGGKQSTDNLITVDMNMSYPEKELILQDFMDVEYVALETTDDFITQGVVEAVGKDVILVTNRRNRDGNIFVYDRSGKGLRKINRFGQGNEEYSGITGIILDEDADEMFVIDYSARKMLVYDLYGDFKRSLQFTGTSYYSYIFNYDRDNLICYKKNSSSEEGEQSHHILVSKQDGSVTREIQLPFSQVATPVIIEGEAVIMPGFDLMAPSGNSNWILADPSADTVYTYKPDGNLSPFMVRTPSVHSMTPQVFLFPIMFTERYNFMYALKKEVDFATMKGFPRTNLVYDDEEEAIFKYTVYNDDFSIKRQVSWGSPGNKEVATSQTLDAFKLVEANENGHLKGRLKEIADGLDEESNPVIMLVKHKAK